MTIVFKLMRAIHETPDAVTSGMADAIGGYSTAVGSDPTFFFLEFWAMKQKGELVFDETPAAWAVVMRAIDAAVALRIVLVHCTTVEVPHFSLWAPAVKNLWTIRTKYQHTIERLPAVMAVSKLRSELCDALREAAATRDPISVLDPLDAWTLLSACEAALVAKKEETDRWAR